MKNELMIDIETTGQNPGCKVLSIGAAGFNMRGAYVEFYRRFDHSKMGEAGLIDEEDTVNWWATQSETARAEAFGGKDGPAEGIRDFKLWFYENFSIDRYDDFRVWCCGLDFDFPILKEFLRRFGFKFPWKFWTQFDYRTVKNIFPEIKNAEKNTGKHTALEDSKAQLRGLRAFYELIEKVA